MSNMNRYMDVCLKKVIELDKSDLNVENITFDTGGATTSDFEKLFNGLLCAKSYTSHIMQYNVMSLALGYPQTLTSKALMICYCWCMYNKLVSKHNSDVHSKNYFNCKSIVNDLEYNIGALIKGESMRPVNIQLFDKLVLMMDGDVMSASPIVNK